MTEQTTIPQYIDVQVDRDDLLAALKFVSRAIPSRPAVPVLAGVRIVADGEGFVYLGAFDYELSLAERIPAVSSSEGAVLVSGKLLLDLVRKLDKGSKVRLHTQDQRLVVNGDGVTYRTIPLPFEDYPPLPDLNDAPRFAAVSATSMTEMAKVLYATGRDATLPMLTAVHLDAPEGTLTASATDRYRLAVYETHHEADKDTAVLIPGPVFKLAAAELKAENVVDIRVKDGIVCLHGAWRTVTIRALEGAFPKYQSLIPTEFCCTAEVDAKKLDKAIEQVAVVAERNIPVVFETGVAGVTLSANTADEATAEKRIPGCVEGDAVRRGFNPQYARDVLKSLAAETVRVKVPPLRTSNSSGPPTVFVSPDVPGLLWMLMPIKLSEVDS